MEVTNLLPAVVNNR